MRVIRFGVFGLVVSLIQNSCDLGLIHLSILSEVLEIPGHPATIDQDTLDFASLIKVSVEWSDNLDTSFSILWLLDLHLILKIHVAL